MVFTEAPPVWGRLKWGSYGAEDGILFSSIGVNSRSCPSVNLHSFARCFPHCLHLKQKIQLVLLETFCLWVKLPGPPAAPPLEDPPRAPLEPREKALPRPEENCCPDERRRAANSASMVAMCLASCPEATSASTAALTKSSLVFKDCLLYTSPSPRD